jgi:hypothetical protein
MDVEKRIEAINEMLERADTRTHTLFDASKSLGALILACGYLVEVIEDQQRRIERLEDVLQNHLETTPRRRRTNGN